MNARAALRVAAVQLNSQTRVEENLARCHELVARAAKRGAELVILPENFAYLGPEAGRREIAERIGEVAAPVQRALVDMARRNSVVVVGGGLPEVSGDPERPYNTCVAYSPQGELLASYRKIHLFDVELNDGTTLRESSATSAGSEPVVMQMADTILGLSICYDLRFPKLYRALVDRGAEVLLVPAAFTLQTGKDHWHVLLRARAIESQSWVVAPNQCGRHAGARASYGHTMIVDPWGIVVAQCSERVGFVVADLDRDIVTSVRSSLPSLRHRRL
jgi:predicted amidohydrolase